MDSGRSGREAVVRAGQATAAPKAKRKKARPATTALDSTRPIPQPYLALAPRPISSQARQQISNPNLVLPSSFRRTATTTTLDAGPSRRRDEGERFVSSLLAPPTVRAGASTSTSNRRAVSPNTGASSRRRTDRLRPSGQGHGTGVGIGAGGNPSMTSLGHLGRIMETDNPNGEERGPTPAPRRRRRIVREVEDDGPGLNRRLTVSSREEGRAIGLARGASMRRLNVWDDVPENDEPPPPFPFPTSSSSRLPPTFTSNELTTAPIPNSPPPIYSLAIQPPPLILPPRIIVESEAEPDRPPSRASTQYESAPSSPILEPLREEEEEGERDDRRMWNEDLLAGYSLEERVQRESARRGSKAEAGDVVQPKSEAVSPISGDEETVDPQIGRDNVPPAETTPAVVAAITIAESPAPAPAPSSPVESLDTTPILNSEPLESTPTPIVEDVQADADDIETTEAKAEQIVSSEKSARTEPPAAKEEDLANGPSPSVPASPVEAIVDPVEPPVENSDQEPVEMTLSTEARTSPVADEQIDSERPDSALDLESTISSEVAALSPPGPETQTVVHESETASATIPSTISTAPSTNPETEADPVISASISKPNLSSASAHRSLSTLLETHESESSEPTSSSASTRKLTRGKAIRRSSSGLIKTLTPSSPSEITAAPLFSAARFDFGKPSASSIPETSGSEGDRTFIHRASAPEIPTIVKPGTEGRMTRDRGEDHGFKVLGGRRLGDPPLNATKSKDLDVKDVKEDEEVIPPHREAALLRRESILAKYVRPTLSTSKPLPPDPIISPKARRPSLPSGPLIDFSDYDFDAHSSTSHHPEIPGLVAANAELLELLEQEAALPQSSTQAANTLQLVEDLRAQLQSIEEVSSESREKDRTPPPLPPRIPPLALAEGEEGIKKKPPPPPPPIRARKAWTSGQKISIAETATSPITPRPSIRRPPPRPDAAADGSPTRKAPPPLPTRRPPPPPPLPQTTDPIDKPVLPPLFRSTSDMNSNTSSMYDGENSQVSTIAPLPIKPFPWRSGKFDRSPQKPRGPRPAPPAPRRSWARVVSDRPLNERTHSEEVIRLDTEDMEVGDELRSSARSNSEMDLSRPTARRRVPEYTDLDVFVSRLEGSGREYEGFSHIAQFLGPAKSPAAPSEALSTLLPAPILVESRRTTKEGKVKLKLSLLGVRVTKCPICLAQFREGEMGVLLPVCGHLGHEECAKRWFREDDRCFVCREKLKVEEGVV